MEFLYVIGGIILLIIFFTIKDKVWDKPKSEIQNLKQDIATIQQLHNVEIENLQKRLNNNSDINAHIMKNEFADIVAASAWKEIASIANKDYAFLRIPSCCSNSTRNDKRVQEAVKKRFFDAIDDQYKYQYLNFLYPELEKLFIGSRLNHSYSASINDFEGRTANLFDIVNLLNQNANIFTEIIYLKNRLGFLEASTSNLSAIPYMANIMADYETYGLERLAKELDWGYSIKRMDKVKSIREIRKDAKAIVEKNKEAQYQLAYLFKLFPALADIIECEFKQLPVIEVSTLNEYDGVRDYLSREEYTALSEVERNQLALDRYRKSHTKTKWQIGRDYELYVGYKYFQKGFEIDYFGSYMGLEDLGRDLIAHKDGKTLIIQCKYWSSYRVIHEKHITQLYGTMISYCIENHLDKSQVRGVFITNITLSDMAKKMANYLGIEYRENFAAGEYPCIKCNIGHDEFGETKIYHLPFDQQYDSTKIKNKGEFYAISVEEAENAGFRRAQRHN